MSEKDMNKTTLLLSLNVGFRSGGARDLRMKYIIKDTKDHYSIHIARQFSSIIKEYARTKNGKKRYVPLDDSMANYLQKYLNTYKAEQYKRKNWKLTGESPVFARDDLNKETAIATCHVNGLLRKFNRHYPEIPRISSHGLRHTFASYLYNSFTLSLDKISRLLGHSSVKVTADYYIHYFPKLGDENIRRRMFGDTENDNKDKGDNFVLGLS